MENILKIDSLQNPRVKTAAKLRKGKVRKETGCTLVEGYREILRATESDWKFIELYYCPELYLDSEASNLVSKIRNGGIPAFLCSEAAFRKMSYRDTPDGLMALSPLVGKSLDELALPANPLLLIAENLEKPGNLGTILRTADATGVDAVIVPRHGAAGLGPTVSKVAAGAAEQLSFAPVANIGRVLAWFADYGIRCIGTSDKADSSLFEADLSGSVALVMGREHTGLSKGIASRCDTLVSLPMQGVVSSLNVSVATGICLYEIVRQRTRPN